MPEQKPPELSSNDIVELEPEVIKILAHAAAEIRRAADLTRCGYVWDHCGNALDEIKHAIRAACGPLSG